MEIRSFIKKNWSNILFAAVIVLLIFPSTSTPIRVQLNRLISFSPSKIPSDKQLKLIDYNWQLSNLEGIKANLSNSKGKVVLINFWATWCPPCIAEMPSLQNLYDEFQGQIDFYFVSQETPEKLKRFMDKKGYTFPVYAFRDTPPEMLSAPSIPTTFVISKEKKIVIEKTGAARWDSESIRDVLKGLLVSQ